MKISKIKDFLPVLLLAFSIILRFWGFWRPSFSGDEGHYVLKAIRILHGVKNLLLNQDRVIAWQNLTQPFLEHAHGPLEFLIMIPFVVFSPREFFIRLPFVFISCLTLILSFIFLEKLRNKKIALYFLILTGSSLYAVWWAQTAMYQTLSISASLMFALAMINFVKKSSCCSLLLLSTALAFGFLVFPDFLMFLPAVCWAVFDKKQFLKKKDVFLACLTVLAIAGVYYVPWIGYGLFWPEKNTGFSFLFSHKLSAAVSPSVNLKGFWGNFFSFPGVFPVWLVSLFSIFLIKKIVYLKYLLLTIVICATVYIFKAYLPYFYFVSIFSLFALLAAEWLASQKKMGSMIIAVIFLINVYGLKPLFSGTPNLFVFFEGQQDDQIQQAGETAKKCITNDNETYISTADAGRATYYFGRISTLYKDGTENRIETMRWFLAGAAPQVKMIHFRKGELSSNLEGKLRQKAKKELKYGIDIVFLYKKCKI